MRHLTHRLLLACLVSLALALAVASQASAASVVNVELLGGGSGRVLSDGGEVDCPGRCSADLQNRFEIVSPTVTFTATASQGSIFAGWGGACSGTQASCEIDQFFDETKTITARFEQLPIFGTSGLTVSVAGSGAGTVTGQGIACPGDCSQSYLKDAAVALTAAPASGSHFAGWSGACSGTSATCNLTMNAGKSVTATFTADPAGDGSSGGGSTGGGSSDPGGRSGVPGALPGCTVVGTAGDDVLTGTRGRDVICGLGGKDRLIGGTGNDVLRGGAGADRLQGGAGGDRLIGGARADRLAGGRGRDSLYARDGVRDRLDGGGGLDRARVDRRKDVRSSIESVF
jgi:Divergent InlB B-repeat domain/RTX calcium-binding nonapeptide repeat (4 copies)